MGNVVSYNKQSDGKYTITVDTNPPQNDRKIISNCYRFKTGKSPLLSTYVSQDGYHFIESDRLETELKKPNKEAQRTIYYFDTQVKITDGQPDINLNEIASIQSSATTFPIPSDYCFKVDPPHDLLQPICSTSGVTSAVTTSSGVTTEVTTSNDSNIGMIVGIIIICIIFSLSIFLLFILLLWYR